MDNKARAIFDPGSSLKMDFPVKLRQILGKKKKKIDPKQYFSFKNLVKEKKEHF